MITTDSTRPRGGPESVTPPIATERQTSCPLCGALGEPRYENLQDRLFGAPGVWGFRGCPACGALWLDPRPTRASIGQAYRTYYTHGRSGAFAALAAATIRRAARARASLDYGFGKPTGSARLWALVFRLYPGLAAHADLLIRHLPVGALESGARLLDVGCGDGEALVFLSCLGWQASGVEIDPMAVRAARARGLEVIEGEIDSAGFADETFDAVTSSHVLEHVHDAMAFLSESRRVLKTGGSLVVVTPNAKAPLLTRHGEHWRGLEPPRHLVLFNADNLARLAADVGLRDIRVKRTARAASGNHFASAVSAAKAVREQREPGWRFWLGSKALEARMIRDVELGRTEGEEIVLIARK